ncbi:CRISPR system Cascade subunit CasB [Microbacterium resistens]|uniref:CRISPR system Cascade subunit CasB n=1 Tax=Microbacterium resistens TaxID=156977 RepID=A0ABU1SC02_9MICO|nr:type I-E CRISPR-associated protein Cse2/CasB [Microbacterium resistens]MDR6867120.1 CRISPR system Cascade subunit CasB [Microbacterium resistens]
MTDYQERADRTADFVAARVSALQAQYQKNVASAVSALARLRRGIGREPGADLELLGLALQLPPSQKDQADSLYDLLDLRGDEIAPEERAAFDAITLFALHQQSRRDAPMHRRGYSFGRSSRLLGTDDAVRRRFTALGTASTREETLRHARGLIQQFRQKRIPLDYGAFARDLLDLHGPFADRVRARWGRDYFRVHHPDDDAADTDDATTTTPED